MYKKKSDAPVADPRPVYESKEPTKPTIHSFKETYKRSGYKTLTWRIIASIDTSLLTWLFSGDIVIGLKVGGMEIVTKLIIYFLHERIWRIGWKKQSDKFHHSISII